MRDLLSLNRIGAALFLVAVLAAFPASPRDTRRPFEPSAASVRRAKGLLKKMSDEEKVGQLIHIGINARYLNRESAEFRRLEREIKVNKVGGVIVFAGPVYETVHLVNRMQQAAKVPLLISADFETGAGMRMDDTVNFPWNMAVAASGDPELARRMGVITGREARALGIHQVFAPVLDINDNPLNPVINVRSFGEDAETVARFGIAFAQGLQSQRVIATAKHFPGHGNTSVDSHRGLPEITFDAEELERNEFVPFKRAIGDRIASVMVSHIAMPALDDEKVIPLPDRADGAYSSTEVVTEAGTIPATLSRKVVTGILKKEMGFNGLVVTDALDMSGLTIYFRPGEAAVRALLAGNDILLKPSDSEQAIAGLKKALAEGRIAREILDAAVLKQLAWKVELGLFKRRITPLESIDSVVSSGETARLAEEIADSAITLVKNRAGAVPLQPGSDVVLLVISNGVDRFSAGRVLADSLSSAGLKVERVALDARSSSEEAAAAAAKARAAGNVVAALFGKVRSGSETSIGIPEAGRKALEEVLSARSDTISIAFGNPYLIDSFPDMGCYIVAYGDMDSLQHATARKLAGRSEFRGKLPVSLNKKYPKGTGIRSGSEK